MHESLKNPKLFVDHVTRTLYERIREAPLYVDEMKNPLSPSAVMFLLGNTGKGNGFTPCLILNKRSEAVRQSGDLCCPGGGSEYPKDHYISRLLNLPGFPLRRWPHWKWLKKNRPGRAGQLRLLLATALRESVEEMGLNPFGIRFLGPLPPRRLVLNNRLIFPLVGWINRQSRFFPNWEVEKIVAIPIETLFDKDRYAGYRLTFDSPDPVNKLRQGEAFPCFRHGNGKDTEILWGATYRITMEFLERVFGFKPPPEDDRPVIAGTRDKNYASNGIKKA